MEKMKFAKSFTLIFLLIVGVLFAIVYYSLAPTTVQSKINPTDSHKATLVRYQGIDVNFKVVVDGEQVYYSPDFIPVRFDFREQISWDITGNIVILEVAGKRIFAYDAEQKRKLSDSEVLAVEYPPFFQYRYEGNLPEENQTLK